MKIGQVPTSPSICEERQAQDVQRPADQVRPRRRSHPQAPGRQREHRRGAQHHQVEHRQRGGVPERETRPNIDHGLSPLTLHNRTFTTKTHHFDFIPTEFIDKIFHTRSCPVRI